MEPLATSRPRRNIQKLARLADYMMFALPVIAAEILNDYREAMHSPEANRWSSAMDEEMDSLNKNHTWTLAKLPPGKKAIGCKWVYTTKVGSQGELTFATRQGW